MIQSLADVGADAADDVDFETALGDPAAYYAWPEAIVSDTGLSLEQKRRFLTEWSQDLVDRQVADQEGMGAAEAGETGDEADLVKRIHAALEQLDTATPSETPEPPGRLRWRAHARAA